MEIKYADEWEAFVAALLSLIFPSVKGHSVQNEITKLLPVAKRIHETSDVNYNLHDLIPYVTISLHLIREEIRLIQQKPNV